MREKKQINIEIGEQIRIARERAKLTQEQLSELTEVSPQYISDLERGVVGISLAKLKKMCCILSVTSDSILFGNRDAEKTAGLMNKCSTLSDDHMKILLEIVDKYVEAINL